MSNSEHLYNSPEFHYNYTLESNSVYGLYMHIDVRYYTTLIAQIAQLCQREVKKLAAKSQKVSKEASVQPRARRLMKEAMIYWRKYEKVEREQRRKAEKEAMEQRKLDDDMREVCVCTLH